jgi:hypothetical protein
VGVAFEGRDGPPSEVAHGVAAVLAQDGVRAILLGHPVDHHQDQRMPIEVVDALLLASERVPKKAITLSSMVGRFGWCIGSPGLVFHTSNCVRGSALERPRETWFR